MALDPRYILLPPLQNIFRDKDTGLPLRNGYLLFFQDNQRTVGKEVFQLTGSPPNYSYIQLGQLNLDGSWQVNLDQNGSITNGVTTTNLYWFPFDNAGNIQLYFVAVYSSTGVFQYSLEAEPNYFASSSGDTTAVSENFVPNGQFLWHTNLPSIPPNIPAGRVTKPITNIAYGGWTFERPNTSGSQDNIVFQRAASWSATPPADPRYFCRISCNSPDSGDSFKDLRLRFDNVNRFSSDTIFYTYGFSANTNTGSNLNAEIILIKNFGTGGDIPTETSLGSVLITSSLQNYFISFIPGDNLNKIIGPNDDDYLQIAIRFPVVDLFDVSITDFLFSEGQFTSSLPPVFPETTNSQYAYRSIAGFLDIADYNSADLYLPIMLTPTGLTYDTTQIGKIYSSSYPSLEINELIADGSQYKTNAFSSVGIPYSRLQKKYFNNVTLMPLYGTGLAFVSTYFTNIDSSSSRSSLRIQNNAIGTATDYTDGAVPTGFAFRDVTAGTASPNLTQSWGLFSSFSNFYIWGKITGAFNATGISPNTSGFTTQVLVNGDPAAYSVQTKSLFYVTAIPASLMTAGCYFTFNNTTGFIVVWYKINGVGTQPSVGGALFYIEIDLDSTWDAQEVAKITAAAISGSKITNITSVAGSAITAGAYFNLNTATQSYYVWYKKDGVGTDPNIAGKLGIEVDILSTDTADQVGVKTLTALNSQYYAVPDLRGMIIKGTDNSGAIDTDQSLRWSFYNQVYRDSGDLTGSFQFDSFQQHTHFYNSPSPGLASYVTAGIVGSIIPSSATGGTETKPLNINSMFVVKY